MIDLIQNALYFPAHDYYMPSTHVHDYRVFEYLPGHKAMVDGGRSYIRRSVTPPEHASLVIPFDLSLDSPYRDILNKLLWGSLPLDKTKPQVHVFKPIAQLTKAHLEAIIKNVPQLNPLHHAVMLYWLGKRNETP